MNPKRKWTQGEIEYLQRNFYKHDVLIEELCLTLNRSYWSVICKAYRLGLKRAVIDINTNTEYVLEIKNEYPHEKWRVSNLTGPDRWDRSG